jgi:hypothetical protein
MGASIWNEDARKLSQVKWLRERDQGWKSKNKNEEHEQRNLTLTCMLMNLQTQNTKNIMNSTSKGAKWIQGVILGCDNCFIFHWGNGYLSWCWNSWMNLYINILNILWEYVIEFEMILMNMKHPKSL